MDAKQFKICIVEDQHDLREMMEVMIHDHADFQLVGSFSDAETAVKTIPLLMPDAVMMDINLPESSGIECVSQLKEKCPAMQFLMCTAYTDNDKIFDSLKAGASGYILKTDGPLNMMKALAEMLAGGSPMTLSIARKVVSSFRKQDETNPAIHTLTKREKEVLEKLAGGFINKEIATQLAISQQTVRTHIQNIYAKLHVNTRVEAANLFLNR